MNITIIGTGYVGLVTGACLADLGNQVVCLDLDSRKIDRLNQGELPIHEPGLHEVVQRNVEAGRLRFSTDVAASVAHGAIQFIAVGTPPNDDGSADLQYVLAAARSIGRHMTEFKVIVNKSTVPVGTAERVSAVIESELMARRVGSPAWSGSANAFADAGDATLSPGFSVVSNPEFLKEGAALLDFTRPDRIILGVGPLAVDQQALALLRQLYAPFNRNHIRTLVMDRRSAEFTKYASNAMLATRISFMNDLSTLADRVGVDIEQVRQGMGSDPRIGYSFLYAGAGYGGSCFPKDLRSLMHCAEEQGQSLRLLDAVEAVNRDQKLLLVKKIQQRLGADLSSKTIALWGLAFKPNTDDMREAPSRVIITALLRAGARVVVHDPVALEEARRWLAQDLAQEPDLRKRLFFVDLAIDAARGADALVLVTEWKAYRSPDWAKLKAALNAPLVFDGRNLYEPEELALAGFELHGMGRSNVRSAEPPEPKDSGAPNHRAALQRSAS
jgi:UDPglucose 6-dehydrogenase